MDIESELRAEHSRSKTLQIVRWVGNDPRRLQKVVDLICGSDRLLSQRASWIVAHTAEQNPCAVRSHLPALLKNLEKPQLHDAIKRNTMKACETLLPLDEECEGLAVDRAFYFLSSEVDAIATKALSLTVVAHACEKIPELANELRLCLQLDLPQHRSPAFRARVRQVTKILDRVSPEQ